MERTESSVVWQPFRLGNLELRNRIVWGPHSTHYANRLESRRLTDYYVRRAVGGVGMIVHEPVVVHPSSVSRDGKIWGFDPANIEHYRRTTDAVRSAGAAIVCQLLHNGRQVDGHSSGMAAWYPSQSTRPGTGETTHQMTIPEIGEVIDGFAASAAICFAGGFDGVELHAAHGYLLQAFLSPTTNLRDDDYGGDAERRRRILLETLEAVRAEIGPDRLLGVRLCADEDTAGGMDATASEALARTLAEGGFVDYLSVVSGSLASPARIVPDMSFPRSVNAGLAAGIRAAVHGIGDRSVRTLVTGRVAEPADAEEIVGSGAADLVGVVRALIADPDWVRKAERGEGQSIRPCVHANDCRDSIAGRRQLQCMVNPQVGPDTIPWPLGVGPQGSAVTPAPARPHPAGRRAEGPVVVVGAGPAGLECALTAAGAGRRVVLFERSDRIGGQLLLAGLPRARSEYRRLVRYFADRLASGVIDVRTGSDADAAGILELDPAAVVLATGARPAAVTGPDAPITTWEALRRAEHGAPLSGNLVVHDREAGNGWSFWAAVETLAERGHRVTAVTPAAQPATGVESGSIGPLLGRLRSLRVRVLTAARVEPCADRGFVVRPSDGATPPPLDAAELVVDPGRCSVTDLSAELANSLADRAAASRPTIRLVGDALAPRRIATAIREGRAAGEMFGELVATRVG